MLKTLQQAYSQENAKIGFETTSSNNTPQKLIRSSESGRTVVVPGYTNDFTFQNDVRRVELSVAKVTDRNWNWSRQNLFVFRRDRTRPATAIFVRLPKEVRNA